MPITSLCPPLVAASLPVSIRGCDFPRLCILHFLCVKSYLLICCTFILLHSCAVVQAVERTFAKDLRLPFGSRSFLDMGDTIAYNERKRGPHYESQTRSNGLGILNSGNRRTHRLFFSDCSISCGRGFSRPYRLQMMTSM